MNGENDEPHGGGQEPTQTAEIIVIYTGPSGQNTGQRRPLVTRLRKKNDRRVLCSLGSFSHPIPWLVSTRHAFCLPLPLYDRYGTGRDGPCNDRRGMETQPVGQLLTGSFLLLGQDYLHPGPDATR